MFEQEQEQGEEERQKSTLYNLLSIEIVGANRCHINRSTDLCGLCATSASQVGTISYY